ncbi:MAG: dipeptidase [Cellulosilyticaceae bacterium]
MKLIDFHCDTAEKLYREAGSLFTNDYHVDIEKLHHAGYSAQWFAFFVHLKQLGDKSPMAYLEEMYAYFVDQVAQNQAHIEIVRNYAEYQACHEQGKLAAFLSLEEGQTIEKDLNNLKRLEDMGIRLMTLTWNYANDLAAPHHEEGGLTAFGKEVVAYLNESPILVDVSHLSEQGLREIKELYHKPILASHSNARGVWNHSRNNSDEGIRLIAESGGIIGTNFYSHFLGNTKKTTIPMLIDNIRYLHNVGGEDVLALGTDFDGIDCDLEVCNCKEMDKLINGMLKVFPSSLVEKFCYKNAERIIRENL